MPGTLRSLRFATREAATPITSVASAAVETRDAQRLGCRVNGGARHESLTRRTGPSTRQAAKRRNVSSSTRKSANVSSSSTWKVDRDSGLLRGRGLVRGSRSRKRWAVEKSRHVVHALFSRDYTFLRSRSRRRLLVVRARLPLPAKFDVTIVSRSSVIFPYPGVHAWLRHVRFFFNSATSRISDSVGVSSRRGSASRFLSNVRARERAANDQAFPSRPASRPA